MFTENNLLDHSGKNVDIWSISLLSFTCLYTVVTGKLVVWTRWWTWVNFFFYSVMSIFVYIAYVWFSNFWDGSRVQFTVIQVHLSPIFFLTIFLVGMSCFLGDLLIEFFRFEHYKTASDFVRGMISHIKSLGMKGGMKELDIDEDELLELSGMISFMQPIEKSHRIQTL